MLELIAGFDCVGEKHANDQVAHEVRAFLTEDGYLLGLQEDITSTYLYVDTDESPPLLLGYVAVALGVVKLSAGEKRNLGQPEFSEFGAIRLAMIGVDITQQGKGIGDELLDAVVGMARYVGQTISVRFLIADANRNLQNWYEGKKFEINRSPKENDPAEEAATLSMRLDLRKRDE